MSKSQSEKHRILLVEDEETLAIGLEYNLSAEGYFVEMADDGKKAIFCIDSKSYDLVILDIMLPYFDGFEIATHIRKSDPQIPILFLTAKTTAEDRIKGLQIGADDYLTKPFHLDELLLRVKGMLRRKSWYQQATEETPLARFGKNEINFANFKAIADNQEIQLTVYEAMLMKYLIDRKDKIVSRKELLQNVWNISSEVETRTVDNFIVRLRKYFEQDPNNPVHIKSIRGRGYIFTD